MDPEIKKRTVVDRIKRAYEAACHGAGNEAQAELSIDLYESDIPDFLQIGFEELGALLLSIESDEKYRGKIEIEAADDFVATGITRYKKSSGTVANAQPHYRVRVSCSLFPDGVLSDQKPQIYLSRDWWTISLPKEKPLRLFKQGTLRGELIGVFGEAWGMPRKADTIFDLLEGRITNKGTSGRPTMTQIENAVRDLNRKLKKHRRRGIKLIKTADSFGGTWKLVIDSPSEESDVSFENLENPRSLQT